MNQFYHFVSENEVDITIGGTATVPDLVTGEFKFSFKQEGATLLVAKGTNSIRMANLQFSPYAAASIPNQL